MYMYIYTYIYIYIYISLSLSIYIYIYIYILLAAEASSGQARGIQAGASVGVIGYSSCYPPRAMARWMNAPTRGRADARMRGCVLGASPSQPGYAQSPY